VGDIVDATPLPRVELKGVSREVTIYEINPRDARSA